MTDKTVLKDVALIINDPTAPGGIKSLNMNNQVLPNVGDPIIPGDAVNKKTMDGRFGELSGALVFKGTLNGTGAATQLADVKVGWLWVVDIAGTLLGEALKIGDEVFCKVEMKGTPKDFTNFEKVPTSDGVLRTTDVINNLTSTEIDKPVSALQAKTLNDNKLDKTDKTQIVNTLTSTDTDKALSANQGKVLSDKINNSSTLLSSMKGTGAQAINPNDNVTVEFRTVIVNDGNSFDTTKNHFSPKVKGLYEIGVYLVDKTTPPIDKVTYLLYLNTTEVAQVEVIETAASPVRIPSVYLHGVVEMNGTTDLIETRIHTGNTAVTIDSSSNFTSQLLRKLP